MTNPSSPVFYKCSGCGAETTVTREDACGLYPDPDSPNAVEVVLQEWGWMRGEIEEQLFCPGCAGPESTGDDTPMIYILRQPRPAMSEDRADRFGAPFSAAQFSQCLSCLHWEGDGERKAFDDMQVPIEIRANQFDHRDPHPDDNGLTYRSEDDDTGHLMD